MALRKTAEVSDPLTLDSLRQQGRTAAGKGLLAKALSHVEAAILAADTVTLLDAAFADPLAEHCQVIGLTGPPGVGKSTLLNRLIAGWRQQDLRVGVIAVDPSSAATGGALLGDRTRLSADPEDMGLFFRSMAARDSLGGLASLTVPGMVLMRALFDRVVIETVGVGQSETDVAGVADTIALCLQPGAGDSLQFMKAGIVEVPDLILINKADVGGAARRTLADVEGAVSLGQAVSATSEGHWVPPIQLVSASQHQGVDDALSAFQHHFQWLKDGDRLAQRRARQAADWVRHYVRDMFGRRGLRDYDHLVAAPAASQPQMPFARMAHADAHLSAAG